MKSINAILFFLILCLILPLKGQEQNNRTEEKTEYRVVKYPNGNIRYESEFVDGKPVGLMKRYSENGNLAAEMMFDSIEDKCYAKLYHSNSSLAAEGWFRSQKKDSVWTYYSESGQYIILREPYENGIINGIVKSYFQGGQVAEITSWKNGVKDGAWQLYFENGNLRSEGTYIDGTLEGLYSAYYPEGNLELSGNYKNNLADGEWTLYNKDGTVNFIFRYDAGKLLNQSELLEKDDEVLQKIQDIPEPEDIIEY